jgi:hypothetical protein
VKFPTTQIVHISNTITTTRSPFSSTHPTRRPPTTYLLYPSARSSLSPSNGAHRALHKDIACDLVRLLGVDSCRFLFFTAVVLANSGEFVLAAPASAKQANRPLADSNDIQTSFIQSFESFLTLVSVVATQTRGVSQ